MPLITVASADFRSRLRRSALDEFFPDPRLLATSQLGERMFLAGEVEIERAAGDTGGVHDGADVSICNADLFELSHSGVEHALSRLDALHIATSERLFVFLSSRRTIDPASDKCQ